MIQSLFLSRPSLRRCCLALLPLALCCACSVATPVHAPSLAQRPLPPPEPAPYRLAAGDLLAVKFYGNAELNEEVTIRPDGMISLAFVDEVRAAGLTPAELDAELTRRYTGELARPQVTVIVRQPAGQRIYVGGEIGTPGVLPLQGGMTLFQALQAAGGLLPTARRQQIVLIRTDASGARIGRSFDVRPVQSGQRPDLDVTLQPFDVVFVPRSKVANVDLFVEQYIRQVLPVTPGFGFVVGGNNDGN